MARTTVPLPESQDATDLVASRAEFLEWRKINAFSQTTLSSDADGLRYFIAWATERGITHPAEVTRAVLERYKAHLFYYRKSDGTPLAPGSQVIRLAPVKAFFRWLARERRIDYNPASELDLPKVARRLPSQALSIEEAEAVIAMPDITTPSGLRDRAILETFYSTGIRRAELIGLDVYDLNFDRSTLVVRQGKGGRDRVVPIGRRALAWVSKYLEDARPALVASTDSETLFVDDHGGTWRREYLGRMVKGYISAAGIERRGACHLFRHTMATLMLEGGADIRYIQEMLGHAEISTTQIYTKVAIDKLVEIHAAAHPAKLEHAHGSENELLFPLAAEAADEDGGDP